jgi:hypothetical protein
LALGYEDLNDHMTLRMDTALQTAVGRDTDLASNATLCRFENRATRQMCWQISREKDSTLITNNEKEYKRVPNLKLENWAT